MIANAKTKSFQKKLQRYSHYYLKFSKTNLGESATRIIVNHLLSDILGFKEITDIKTEYPVPGGFIDYLIQINGENIFVIEVKPINTKLNSTHLRQAIYYAILVGAEWVILTNAKNIELYKVSFDKPIKVEKILSVDLRKLSSLNADLMLYLTKKSVMRNYLNRLKTIVEISESIQGC